MHCVELAATVQHAVLCLCCRPCCSSRLYGYFALVWTVVDALPREFVCGCVFVLCVRQACDRLRKRTAFRDVGADQAKALFDAHMASLRVKAVKV